MKLLNWCLSAVLLTLSTAPPTRAEDCALKQLASVELAETADGSLLVPVTLANTQVYLKLATSYPTSTLRAAFVTEHKLPIRVQEGWTDTDNGHSAPMRYSIIEQFSLGQIQFKSSNVHIHALSTLQPHYDGIPVAGILGWDVLSNFDVELDLIHHRMKLYSPKHCPAQVVYWASTYDATPIYKGGTGEPYFPMELDGRRLETALGTDRASTTLRTDVSKKLYQFDEKSSGVYQAQDSTGQEKSYYRAMSINSKGLSVINAHVDLVVVKDSACKVTTEAKVTGYSGCYAVHPLTLGRNVLAKLRIYLATQEGIMYFTAADAVQSANTS